MQKRGSLYADAKQKGGHFRHERGSLLGTKGGQLITPLSFFQFFISARGAEKIERRAARRGPKGVNRQAEPAGEASSGVMQRNGERGGDRIASSGQRAAAWRAAAGLHDPSGARR